ncbi:MAG: MFS transporter [Planctomycetota bacterium]
MTASDPVCPRAHDPVSRNSLAAGSIASMLTMAACVGIPSVMLVEIANTFHLDNTRRGLIASVRSATILLTVLLSGPLADRLGKRLPLALGAAAVAAGLLLTGFASSYETLLLASAVAGLGCGVAEALVSPLVVELYPRSSSSKLNLFHSVFNLGIVLACASYLLVRAGIHWTWAFRIAGLLSIAPVILFAVAHFPPAAPWHEARNALGASLRRPLFWILMLAMFLTAGVEIGATTWIANFLEVELGAPGAAGAWGLTLFAVAMMVGRLSVSRLLLRVPPVPLLLASSLLGALVIALAAISRNVLPGIVLFVLAGVSIAAFWPTILAYASDRLSCRSSTLFALLAAGGISGAILSPALVGLVGDRLSLRAGIASLSGLLLLAALLFAGLLLSERASLRRD